MNKRQLKREVEACYEAIEELIGDDGITIRLMSEKKELLCIIPIESALALKIRAAAKEDGLSVSTWIEKVIRSMLRSPSFDDSTWDDGTQGVSEALRPQQIESIANEAAPIPIPPDHPAVNAALAVYWPLEYRTMAEPDEQDQIHMAAALTAALPYLPSHDPPPSATWEPNDE